MTLYGSDHKGIPTDTYKIGIHLNRDHVTFCALELKFLFAGYRQKNSQYDAFTDSNESNDTNHNWPSIHFGWNSILPPGRFLNSKQLRCPRAPCGNSNYSPATARPTISWTSNLGATATHVIGATTVIRSTTVAVSACAWWREKSTGATIRCAG